ncbi:MAG: NTP transferase domain-containing protein [Rikenellaceae bacterium]
MKITAVIPIRAGSQRVKNKNLRPFGDTTLLELKIDRLKEAGVFDDIVVNTDSEEAIQIAKAKGVSYHRREPYYASSECSGSDFFKHLGEVTQTDAFVYTPCTSPFIATQTIKKCIETYKVARERLRGNGDLG